MTQVVGGDMKSAEEHAAYMRAYRARKGAALAERQAAYYSEWRKRNKQKLYEQQKEYRALNKERIAAYRAEYDIANKEKKTAYRRAYYAARKAACAEWQVEYNRQHPEIKRTMSRNRKALIRGADGHHTPAQIASVMKAQAGLCVYCLTSLANGFHGDHIVPVSRGGSNWISNIQLLCPTCNIQKHDKTHSEFVAWRAVHLRQDTSTQC